MSQERTGKVGYRDGEPWDYPVTIASEFTRHGYQTQAIGKLHVFPERSQIGFQNVILHDGFLHYARRNQHELGMVDDYIPWLRERLGPHADYFDHGVNCNSYVARPWDKPEHLHPTNFVATQAVDFLRRRDPRKPFFLMLSFHRPHPPYDPPAWAFEQYLDAPMPPPQIGDWHQLFEPHAQPGRPDALYDPGVPERLLRRARAGYYGHMTHIDHQLNRFFETLAEYGQRENSVICFVSDHGEMMGDHHLFRKGYPYEGSARVPLLLKAPHSAGIRPGSVHHQVAELRDVMPTLLECAGLPVPDTVDGRSLLPIARGDRPAWRDMLHGEHTLIGQSIQWLTNEREKYVWMSASGHEQLFDLEADPHELHDRARDPQCAERLARWRRELIRVLDGRPEGFVADGALVAGRPVQPVIRREM
jgi:arylsulfatase A-like enzyme